MVRSYRKQANHFPEVKNPCQVSVEIRGEPSLLQRRLEELSELLSEGQIDSANRSIWLLYITAYKDMVLDM